METSDGVHESGSGGNKRTSGSGNCGGGFAGFGGVAQMNVKVMGT